MNHLYISTYCQHDKHEDCRLTCKICESPCLCPCHTVVENKEVKTQEKHVL